jgi:phytanoyl-CoA hydroxylase
MMLQTYHDNGFVILENFIPPSKVDRLRKRAYVLADQVKQGRLPTIMPQNKMVWSMKELEETTRSYCCYWENGEFQDTNRLLKLSHSLHRLDPIFREFSQSLERTQLFCSLGLTKPKIVQSMLHFKPAQSDSAIGWHQDATYIATTPHTTIGLWLALEDSTLENGCLCVIPGAHRQGLCSQMVRSSSGDLSFNTLQEIDWPLHEAVDLPVKAGTLIAMNGLLPHRSGPNASHQSRLALTFHLIDLTSSYSETNWLPFSLL